MKNDMPELMACPFCKAQLVPYDDLEDFSLHPKDDCLLRGYIIKNDSQKWNTRADLTAPVTDDGLREAVEIGEYALVAQYTGMLTGDTIITREVLKTLITHALKGEIK